MRFFVLIITMIGFLEARVVDDEYRGNTIIYSKESYNQTTVEYWEKEEEETKKQDTKRNYRKYNKRETKRDYKKYRKSYGNVVNDEYRGNSIHYSSDIRMTRADWEKMHNIKRDKSRNTTSSYEEVVSDEYRGD
ncbi:MAG: hypothetical protein KU38_02955 [Sulfurovum sp. FS08-3]|nr:MAG: hypothetical protein KU38_02955 [Sulfurovum sp. FS08-3]